MDTDYVVAGAELTIDDAALVALAADLDVAPGGVDATLDAMLGPEGAVRSTTPS